MSLNLNNRVFLGKIRICLLLVSVSIIFYLQTSVKAEEDVNLKLKQITEKISTENNNLKNIEDNLKRVELLLIDLQKNLKEIKNSQNLLAKEAVQRAKDKEKFEKNIKEVDDKKARLEALLRKRARALYLSQKGTFDSPLASDDDVNSFLKYSFYFQKIRKEEKRAIAELESLRVESLALVKQLNQVIEYQVAIKEKFSQQENVLKEKINEEKNLVFELETDKKARKSSILALQREAEGLESVVSSIAGGAPEDKNKKEESRDEDTKELPQFGKGLILPVTGKVVRGFGAHKVSEFSDIVMNKGVEISAPQGTAIQAVSEGVVRFVGEMPGYGPLVMVDHGQRYFTLYGRIQGVAVKVGAKVAKGDTIGLTGEKGKEGGNFYFEVRKNGKAQNPQTFFGSLMK